MFRLITTAIFSSCLLAQSATALAAYEEKIIFETGDKQTTEAYQGAFEVPENRQNPFSRMIPIKYIRFPATGTQSGPPIVYLAGGPGGSGIRTAKYRRYAMFMALREYGDVIALDQRGTGASNILPECTSSQIEPTTVATSDAASVQMNREALRECLAFWKSEGIDIAGYNTVENAHDLDALREILGAEKIVLWGTSYGSHLALAALKEIGDRVDKVILSSAEGLNQTIKLPARTDAYFARLQQAVDSQPAAKAAYPDIKAMMLRVHVKLEANPVMLRVAMKDGTTADFLWQRRHMQELASAMISDPRSIAQLLGLYLAMDQGITAPFEQFLGRFITPGKPITLDAMSNAMDIASGMTADRKKLVAEQAKTALLKDYLNYTYHYDGVAPALDLGDSFREKPVSDTPVLLFSGTLDGRTYIESQLEATSGLTNLHKVTVVNAGHNLYMSSQAVQDAINEFMEDKPLSQSTISIELPDLAPKL